MQRLKIFRGQSIAPSGQADGSGRAGDGTNTAADTPLRIDYRQIIFHTDGFYRTAFGAASTARAFTEIGVPDEIGGHQHIPGDFPSSDCAHRPATAAAAIAGMLDSFPGVIHEMNQSRLLRSANDLEGFILTDLPSDPGIEKIFRQVIVFDAAFQGMTALASSQQLCGGAAGTVHQGDAADTFNDFLHHFERKDGMRIGVQGRYHREETERL